MAARALKPGGRVFFIDSKYDQTSTARDHHLGPPETGTATRRLNDGREFEIVKIFYRGEELERRLSRLGWRVQVRETAHYFLYGSGGLA